MTFDVHYLLPFPSSPVASDYVSKLRRDKTQDRLFFGATLIFIAIFVGSASKKGITVTGIDLFIGITLEILATSLTILAILGDILATMSMQ
ncbi:MAG: hypothetical protein U9R43_02965 [Thermodesulfobacteriota bacterium]|nr:hypothetical protein [Thermodesulfobacteriota bacterium]